MGERLLLVEDDASLAWSLAEGLADEGFAVTHVADGDAALGAMRAEAWALVVLDWWLPRRDGLAVLADCRREGVTTPVLFLTARDAVGDRVRGLEGGADDYLCKPFAFAELLARVRVLLRRARPAPAATLAYWDVRVDLATRRAQRAGRPLDLTAKELAVLAYLLGRPGEVLTRAQIYAHVWGEEYDFVSNTLDVHLASLRRILEAAGPRVIHTVRGRGYRLGDPPPPGGGGGA